MALVLLFPALDSSANDLLDELKEVPHKIVFESHRDGNWELMMVDADGSNPVNLTGTPDFDELFPHVSPDGAKVCFTANEGSGAQRIRNVYYMNLDGTQRTLVAKNARQACWMPDSRSLAFLKGEFDEYSHKDFATRGLFYYDSATGQTSEHANRGLYHLYNICPSPDGKWFVATVHGGMGYQHTTLAIEAHGTRVLDLGVHGCRPEISPDGTKIAWTPDDWSLAVADLDFSGPVPKAAGLKRIVTSDKPIMVYHVDWSPDGRYVAFCRGPERGRLAVHPAIVGEVAEGWNICVADAAGGNRWVPITSDGLSNKEPDWLKVEGKDR
jgi:Tol biopolymer transport system component